MYIYLVVSANKFELPTFVADSMEELVTILGVSQSVIKRRISETKSGRNLKDYKIRVVEIDEEEYE